MLADLLLALPFVLAISLIVRDMRRQLKRHCQRRGDSLWRVMLDLPESEHARPELGRPAAGGAQ